MFTEWGRVYSVQMERSSETRPLGEEHLRSFPAPPAPLAPPGATGGSSRRLHFETQLPIFALFKKPLWEVMDNCPEKSDVIIAIS